MSPLYLFLYFFLEIKLIIDFVSSQNETQDFLFIVMEEFCVLQWDAGKSELLTRFEHFTLLATVSQVPCYVN
jgi:hypothetical protein